MKLCLQFCWSIENQENNPNTSELEHLTEVFLLMFCYFELAVHAFAETLSSESIKSQFCVPCLMQKLQIHIVVWCFCTSMMAILHCFPLTCLSLKHLTKHHLLWISLERGVFVI
jgi:hypothetical protein